jgi:beta-cyano-L-alanine hydratase/nitrilase|uniref:CN hydrolase domain-containing protein n=1 Tax=Globisporangium ultimum (strain ATCC 200006 / CBS 805.95 / DAOM BR144) TaxID=431595 RepID=K3WA51_GLOUD
MKIRVGVAQTATKDFDFDVTLERFRGLVQEASALGVQFLLFPEAFFGGYPKHTNFGAVVGLRGDQGRKDFAKYFNGAIAIPSPEADAIAQVSKEFNVAIGTGVIEKEGSTLYCSVLYVDPVVGIVGKHRKLMPTASERLIWGNGDGSKENLSAQKIQLAGGASVTVGGGVCWENMMPLLRYNYYQQGIQLYTAPTVDARENWLHTVTHIAMESRCFVLSANQFATTADYPAWHQEIMKSEFKAAGNDLADDAEIIGGGSCIISPLGEVLAGPLRKKQGILSAEIDLDDLVGARFDLDATGHYSRSDVFSLNINSN